MIKRIRFATPKKDVSAQAFSAAWRHAVAAAAQVPSDVRPSRIAVCLTLPDLSGPDLSGPDRRHDGIGIEWFADAGHLQRFTEWLGTSDGQRLLSKADRVADRAQALRAELGAGGEALGGEIPAVDRDGRRPALTCAVV